MYDIAHLSLELPTLRVRLNHQLHCIVVHPVVFSSGGTKPRPEGERSLRRGRSDDVETILHRKCRSCLRASFLSRTLHPHRHKY